MSGLAQKLILNSRKRAAGRVVQSLQAGGTGGGLLSPGGGHSTARTGGGSASSTPKL
nr:MAG TPA: hypothetical protein [Caudoviricetes sp.]